MISLSLNGKIVQLAATPDTPLLWALRDELGYTGAKFGCGIAICGACTVHVDGRPIRACVTPIETVAGKQVTTIEARGVETVELFTDGYFDVGAEATLDSWEARHAEVELEDPAKVGRFRSTKGSVPGRWSDDRTYVSVRLR